MYLRYACWVLLDWVFYILQYFMFFPAYWTYLLGWEVPFVHWFFHTDNPYGERHEKFWKHYGRKKWWVAWRWNCVRNSHWNFKTKVWIPKKGKITDIEFKKKSEENPNIRTPYNFANQGEFLAEYKIDHRTSYFFYASCHPVSYPFFGKLLRQIHCGTDPNYRFTLKIRHRKL